MFIKKHTGEYCQILDKLSTLQKYSVHSTWFGVLLGVNVLPIWKKAQAM